MTVSIKHNIMRKARIPQDSFQFRLEAVHTFDMDRFPSHEEDFYSDKAPEELLKNLTPLKTDENSEDEFPLSKTGEDIIKKIRKGHLCANSATNTGKTTVMCYYAGERALQNRSQKQRNAPHMVLLSLTNTLLFDLRDRLAMINHKSFGDNLNTEVFSSDSPGLKRLSIKENIGSIDILCMTPDMYLQSMVGSFDFPRDLSRIPQGKTWGRARNDAWVNGLQSPDIIMIDEIDFANEVTVSCMGVLLRFLEYVNSNRKDFRIAICSATIPNPEELMNALLGHDRFLITSGKGLHGEKHYRVFQDELVSSSGDAIYSVFEYKLLCTLKEGLNSQNSSKGIVLFVVLNKKYIDWLDDVYELKQQGVELIHGDLENKENRESFNKLNSGESWIALVTNVLEVGVHLAKVRSIVFLGLPPKVRSFLQFCGRAGRTWKDFAIIDVVLRRSRERERVLLDSEEKCRDFLYSRTPEPVIANLSLEPVLEFALLLAPVFGIDTLKILYGLLHDVPGIQRSLRRIFTKFLSKGYLNLVDKDKFEPTSLTKEAFFQVNLRGIGKRYPLKFRKNDDVSTRYETIGSVDALRAAQQMRPGQPFLFYGNRYITLESKDSFIIVRKARSGWETDTVANNRVKLSRLHRACLAKFTETFNSDNLDRKQTSLVCLDRLTIALEIDSLNLVDVKTREILEEKPPELGDKFADTYQSYAFSLYLGNVDPQVASVTAGALTKAIQKTLSLDTLYLDPVIHRDKDGTSTLHLLEGWTRVGVATLAWENAPEVLTEAVSGIQHCRCRMKGCMDCLGRSFYSLQSRSSEKYVREGLQLLKLREQSTRTLIISSDISSVRRPTSSGPKDSILGSPGLSFGAGRVYVISDLHMEIPLVTLNGENISKRDVVEALLDSMEDPKVIILNGDTADTRPSLPQRVQRTSRDGFHWLLETLYEHDLLDITVFVRGNHDWSLHNLATTRRFLTLNYCVVPLGETFALVWHGAGSGLETVFAQTREVSEIPQSLEDHKKIHIKAFRTFRERLNSGKSILGIKIPKHWWVVPGHLGYPVHDLQSRVCSGSHWTREIGGDFGRRFVCIDTTRNDGVYLAKIDLK